jgi:hypothetical protein
VVTLATPATQAIAALERRRVAGAISDAEFERRCSAIRAWLHERNVAMTVTRARPETP